MNAPIVGGFGNNKPITDEIAQLALQHKGDVEAETGENFSQYEPYEFKSQVVNGTNFDIFIKVNGDRTLKVRIYRSLPHAGSQTRVTSSSFM